MIHELQRRAAGRSVKKVGRGRELRKTERGRGRIPTRGKPRLGRSGVGSCDNGTRGGGSGGMETNRGRPPRQRNLRLIRDRGNRI